MVSALTLHGILFDLDGTLLDSAPDLALATNALLSTYHRPPLSVDELRPFVSGGARSMLQRAFGIDDNSPPDVKAAFESEFPCYREQFLGLYSAAPYRESRLFPGIQDLLSTLDASKYPWGIVTNKAYRFARAILEALALNTTCACLIGGDSTPTPKPHPAPLLLAAGQLKLAPGAIAYVGDDRRDMDAARAAQMMPLVAGWGYGQPDEIAAHPLGHCAVVHTPGDLLKLLA
jgi:2-phosphoglycolate phosphatase